MIRAMWSAASGMDAQNLNIDVISNNLANVQSTGYKKSRAEFQDLMYQAAQRAGTAVTAQNERPVGLEVGLGVRPAAVQKIFTEGDLQRTDNDLDLAIEGDGFFQVEMPDGEIGYTRAGAFKLDSEGRVVTADGYPVVPEIVIPEDTTQVSVGEDGTVEVFQAGENEPAEVGNLELAMFSNEAGLHSLGSNMFEETVASGDPILEVPGENGMGKISQGFLENSNVSVMEEMINMIASQRAYEANSKSIKTSDEMLQVTNQLI